MVTRKQPFYGKSKEEVLDKVKMEHMILKVYIIVNVLVL